MIFLIALAGVTVYLTGCALRGVLEGCVRAYRTRLDYRSGERERIHEAYRRLMRDEDDS